MVYGVGVFYGSDCSLGMGGVYNYVISNTWSVKPWSVSGSYLIHCVVFLDRIKSMHDSSDPLWNVWHAGGPG
jgi:hypothetical protein